MGAWLGRWLAQKMHSSGSTAAAEYDAHKMGRRKPLLTGRQHPLCKAVCTYQPDLKYNLNPISYSCTPSFHAKNAACKIMKGRGRQPD
jgi:hypothetical protein